MRIFLRCFAADFYKTRRLPFWMAHLAIPICTVLFFLAYYAYAPWDSYDKTAAYFQVLAVAFPFLTGVFCVMLAEQELAAASCQRMLAVSRRLPVFYSKIVLLTISGLAAVLIAGVGFGMGNIADMKFCFESSLLLFAVNIWGYVFHWFLALRFSKGVCIMTGMAESLIAALCLTSLGDEIWCYVPCAWQAGMVMSLLEKSVKGYVFDIKCNTAILLCGILTIVSVVLYSVWACRWEGTHACD